MLRTLLIVAFAVPALYVAAYFVCVTPGLPQTFGGTNTCFAEYRWFSDDTCHAYTIFAPIHRLDRERWRPTKWQQPVPMAEQLQILVEQQRLPKLQVP